LIEIRSVISELQRADIERDGHGFPYMRSFRELG